MTLVTLTELRAKMIPCPVPISPEYAESLVAMDRINNAVLKNLCESFRLPARAVGVMNPQPAEECAMCAHIASRKAFEAETGLKTKPPLFPTCPAHGRELEADTPTAVIGGNS